MQKIEGITKFFSDPVQKILSDLLSIPADSNLKLITITIIIVATFFFIKTVTIDIAISFTKHIISASLAKINILSLLFIMLAVITTCYDKEINVLIVFLLLTAILGSACTIIVKMNKEDKD